MLNNAINDLENTTIPVGCKIAIKVIAKRNVISCRGKLFQYSQEGKLWNKLKEETKGLNVQPAIPSYNISVTYV